MPIFAMGYMDMVINKRCKTLQMYVTKHSLQKKTGALNANMLLLVKNQGEIGLQVKYDSITKNCFNSYFLCLCAG